MRESESSLRAECRRVIRYFSRLPSWRGFLADFVRERAYQFDGLGRDFSVYDMVSWTGSDPGTVKKIMVRLERAGEIQKLPLAIRNGRGRYPYELTDTARQL